MTENRKNHDEWDFKWAQLENVDWKHSIPGKLQSKIRKVCKFSIIFKYGKWKIQSKIVENYKASWGKFELLKREEEKQMKSDSDWQKCANEYQEINLIDEMHFLKASCGKTVLKHFVFRQTWRKTVVLAFHGTHSFITINIIRSAFLRCSLRTSTPPRHSPSWDTSPSRR